VHTATLAATCENPTSLSVLAQLKPYQLNHSISVPKLCSVTLCFGRSTACMNHKYKNCHYKEIDTTVTLLLHNDTYAMQIQKNRSIIVGRFALEYMTHCAHTNLCD
jgi:hypothetical protein